MLIIPEKTKDPKVLMNGLILALRAIAPDHWGDYTEINKPTNEISRFAIRRGSQLDKKQWKLAVTYLREHVKAAGWVVRNARLNRHDVTISIAMPMKRKSETAKDKARSARSRAKKQFAVARKEEELRDR